jgi:hypothetical protein
VLTSRSGGKRLEKGRAQGSVSVRGNGKGEKRTVVVVVRDDYSVDLGQLVKRDGRRLDALRSDPCRGEKQGWGHEAVDGADVRGIGRRERRRRREATRRGWRDRR